MKQQPPDIFFVTRDDPRYLQQLRAEEEFWDKSRITLAMLTPRPAIQQYMNERLTGQADQQWFEMIPDYGDFRRGCVLGAGPGAIESRLLSQLQHLHLTFYDISGETLGRLQRRLEQQFPGRTAICHQDLNFVTLAANSYDLIIANECLHHLLNLEHVAFQINNALTPDGFVFMFEVVSESYFQFSEEKKRLFEALVGATYDGPGRAPPVQWPDRSNWTLHSPFESVRSGEILDVFGRYLQQVRLRTYASLLTLTLFLPSMVALAFEANVKRHGRRQRVAAALRAALFRRKTDLAGERARDRLLFLLDRVLTDTGYLEPGLAFAIYRKRGTGGASG